MISNEKKKKMFCPKCQSDDISFCSINYNTTCNKCGHMGKLGNNKEWLQVVLDANGKPIK